MADVSSTALTLCLPIGARFDPDGRAGSASVLAEWCLRGAGGRDTHELNNALDALGCRHSESVRSRHVVFSATQLGRNLPDVLKIFSDIVRRPGLDDETFDRCRDLIRQDLDVLEDEPAKKAVMLLREKFYPSPLGRGIYGTHESLAALSGESVREHAAARMTPHGAIVSVAGDIDWAQLRDLTGEYFGDWSADSSEEGDTGAAEGGVTHIHKESAQAHITLAHATVPISSDQYYPARLGETVLSSGMSSRLFTEVREKRGLVYHVSSRYHSLRDHAGMFTYAGTVPAKAQETLEVTVHELRRVSGDLAASEMTKAKTQLKSALVMQGESTAARAAAMAADFYHLARIRPLSEVSQAIEAVTADQVRDHLEQWPAREFTMLVVGPEPLDSSILTA